MLQNTSRFQDDVKRYTESISKLSSDQEKLIATNLLNELIYEVKNIDNIHMDILYNKPFSTPSTEIRDKLISIRKKLDAILK
jgi:hypothetical protein